VTLRQILDVLWKRKWIIVSVMVIAVLTAFAYLQVRAVSYSSAGLLRLNSAVTDAALSGELGGVDVEFDAAVVTSPAVVDPAAKTLAENPDVLAANIVADLDSSERLAQVAITALGGTPTQSRERAQAAMDSYQEYVDTQVTSTMTTLQKNQQKAIEDAQKLQQRVQDHPGDSIASTNLATALQKMTTLTSTIESVNDAGAARTTVMAKPTAGELTVPSGVTILLLAFATGLVVGVAIALIRDQFDNRLRGEDEVQDLTGVRSIGELSWDRKLASMRPPLPVAGNDRSDLSERLRTLRSNLSVFLPARGAAFVTTSVEPGDGKSFVSANLALAWARAGKRVILVGGDLRRPDLAQYFGEAMDGEGLAEILGQYDLGEALAVESVQSRLNTTRYRRLLVLPSGAEPPEPADLIARPIFSEIVHALRGLADIVIIDSPPAIGLADAALLAAQTDGALLLASARRTDRVHLVEAVESLRAAGAEVLGIVTNRSRRKLPKTYSSYYVSTGHGQRPAPSPRDDPASDELHDRFSLGKEPELGASSQIEAKTAFSPGSEGAAAEEIGRLPLAAADEDATEDQMHRTSES
jgi:capsular exopolysaccharide synthesis family protein